MYLARSGNNKDPNLFSYSVFMVNNYHGSGTSLSLAVHNVSKTKKLFDMHRNELLQ